MTVKISHVIAGFVVIAILLGAAFSFGMKWSGNPETNAAAVSEALEEESATTSEEVIEGEPEPETYEVIKVVDGDTIAIRMNGKSETLRLIGIDTPETVDTRVEVQCFGKESSDKLKSLLDGKKVRLEMDVGEGERDKYKRLLAYVFREDGLFVNKYMIEEGYAYEYTYDTDYKYQKEFKAAQARAKTGEKGLWKPNACPAPTVKGKATAAPKVEKKEVPGTVIPAPAPTSTAASTSHLTVQQQESTLQQKAVKKTEPKEPDPEPAASTEGTYTCSSNKYNCTHFKTHAEAQAVFDQCGGADNDVHKLDNNKDGEACESLP
jgi:endonuclease YncB( thermonuclease family)